MRSSNRPDTKTKPRPQITPAKKYSIVDIAGSKRKEEKKVKRLKRDTKSIKPQVSITDGKLGSRYEFAGPWSGNGKINLKFNCKDAHSNRLLKEYFEKLLSK